MSFRIRNATTFATIPGLPSPRLIEEGEGEAWESMPGFWRVKEDTDPKHTIYTRVRIEHLDDWTVDVDIKVTGPDEVEEYRDSFVVLAENDQEAMRLAVAAAHEDVESRYGDEYGSIVTTIRTRRGDFA